jgi:hypothetical protein
MFRPRKLLPGGQIMTDKYGQLVVNREATLRWIDDWLRGFDWIPPDQRLPLFITTMQRVHDLGLRTVEILRAQLEASA